MSWNMPVHHDQRLAEGGSRSADGDALLAKQVARTARTVAQHSTDAQDCRILLEMLGLPLDALRGDGPPTH